LAVWFLLVDQIYLGAYLVANIATLGADALLYVTATHTWLTGGDPWLVVVNGMRFAAPPPTLLFYAPFGFLSPSAAAAFWLVADTAAVIFVLKRLRLEWWWAFFPPIVESALAGNPEPVVLALLVASSTANSLAPVLKIYAFVPLLGERRWVAIITATLLLIITAFVLPWGQYLADAPLIASTLNQQTVGLSAFSVPWLLPVGILGLIGLGLRRSGWLAVPVLWPHTQLHYASTALPKMTNVLAFGFSLPVPGAPAVAVAAQALLERRRRAQHSTEPDPGLP
jgi:hypothetical protein